MTSRKKLPRAVTRTAHEMRMGVAGEAALSRDLCSSSVDAGRDTPDLPADRATRASSYDTAPATRTILDFDERRFFVANTIVERHANFASLGGVIPLPLINVAGVTAIILRMVRSLCIHYGVPYDKGRARAVAVSLAAGTVPSTAALVTSSTLVYFIPGVNLLGLAVSSVTASACTRAVGHRFVQHFETGAKLIDFPVVDRR